MPPSVAASVEARDGHAVVNGVRLRYRESGQPSDPPVLVLHGLMGHAREWDVLTTALAGRHRVVAVDQRGHGRSDWADDYTYPVMVEDVIAVIDALGLAPVDLVGHSMGGMIAMSVAADRPELVRRLVLLDIAPESLATSFGRETLPQVLATFAAASYADPEQAVAEWLAGDPFAQESLIRHYVHHVLVPRPDGRLRYRFDAARLPRFVASLDRSVLWRAVERITAPTLLVHGRHSDLVSPADVAAVCARLRHGASVEIADAGHDLGVQQPAAVAAAVGTFLDG